LKGFLNMRILFIFSIWRCWLSFPSLVDLSDAFLIPFVHCFSSF
jgi:hypothetical protein